MWSKSNEAWRGRATPHLRMGPTITGRPSHLIEAAKRGRLDQMIFFSAPLTTRAPPTTVRRPSDLGANLRAGVNFKNLPLIVIAPRIPPGRTKEPKSPTNSWNRLATKLRNKNTYVVNKLFRPAAVTYQIWVEAKGCEPFWAQLGSFWKPKLIQNPSKPSPNRFQIWFQKQLPPPSGFQTGNPQK